jgi:hypothetical protein
MKTLSPHYFNIAQLMLDTLPVFFETEHFALKGGTAINFFIQEMPRLSVDIDAVFVDHALPRKDAFEKINNELLLAKERLENRETGIVQTTPGDAENVSKLFIERHDALVKIEVNPVFRGTLFPCEKRRLVKNASDVFETDFQIPTIALSEIYGGKIVAAFERQHPRDLFDVKLLFDTIGITEEIVECFVSYLIGSKKPIHETIFSHDHDFTRAYENEFVGMTNIPLSLDDLFETRARLRDEISRKLTANQKDFLLSLVSCEPRWELMRCPHLRELPAIRWKLQNLEHLRKINKKRFAEQREKLEAAFVEFGVN